MTTPTPWQIIFQASHVNGGLYPGDYLTEQPWAWPRDTWLQRRLQELREQQQTTQGGSEQ